MNIERKIKLLNSWFYIIDKAGKKVKFKLNKAQEDFLRKRGRTVVLCKSRQLGFSTLSCLENLLLLVTGRNVELVIVSNTMDSAENLFEKKIMFAFNNLPEEILSMITVEKRNRTSITINIGQYKNSLSVKLNTSGMTVTNGHITELSLMDKESPKKAKDIMHGILPAIGTQGTLSVEGTVKTSKGEFYNLWHNSDFTKLFYDWRWDHWELDRIDEHNISTYLKERDEQMNSYAEDNKLSEREGAYYWQRLKSFGMNWSTMYREYPTTVQEAFDSGGVRFFDAESLRKQEVGKIVMRGKGNTYRYAERSGRYIVGVDVALGVGKDYSAIVVWDLSKEEGEMSEVAYVERTNTTDLSVFTKRILSVCSKYGNPLLVVESNSIGEGIIGRLDDYNNLYYRKQGRAGFSTNKITKPDMLQELSYAIRMEEVALNDDQLIRECKNYDVDDIKKNDTDGHYDVLMAACISWRCRQLAMRGELDYKKTGYM